MHASVQLRVHLFCVSKAVVLVACALYTPLKTSVGHNMLHGSLTLRFTA